MVKTVVSNVLCFTEIKTNYSTMSRRLWFTYLLIYMLILGVTECAGVQIALCHPLTRRNSVQLVYQTISFENYQSMFDRYVCYKYRHVSATT